MFARYFEARGLSGDLPPTPARGTEAPPITLVFENRHRIQFSVSADGRALVRARVVDLPPPGERRDRLLEQIARFGVRPAMRHAASCVIDKDERAVWLQWIELPTLKPADFEQLLDAFIDILAFWKTTLTKVDGNSVANSIANSAGDVAANSAANAGANAAANIRMSASSTTFPSQIIG
jgi:hypothetical protein